MAKRNDDVDLIRRLGGPSEVARLLGVTKQAVHNWYATGIPRLRRLHIANELKRRKKRIPAELSGEIAA